MKEVICYECSCGKKFFDKGQCQLHEIMHQVNEDLEKGYTFGEIKSKYHLEHRWGELNEKALVLGKRIKTQRAEYIVSVDRDLKMDLDRNQFGSRDILKHRWVGILNRLADEI